MTLKVMDLFSGIGGFSLGLESAGMETVAFCEIDPFCQKILKKHWPEVPIYNDVRSIDYEGSIDVICGGFPCQPFSTAGKRKGTEDDRYLWPAMLDLVKKHRSTWFIGENVAGIIGMALDEVLSQLEDEGYATRAFVIPACAVDAPHRRERVWIIAHANGQSEPDGSVNGQEQLVVTPDVADPKSGRGGGSRNSIKKEGASGGENAQSQSGSADVADAEGKRMEGDRGDGQQITQAQTGSKISGCHSPGRRAGKWPVEPAVARMAYGVPNRVDRVKSLGNSIVWPIVSVIGKYIVKIEEKDA